MVPCLMCKDPYAAAESLCQVADTAWCLKQRLPCGTATSGFSTASQTKACPAAYMQSWNGFATKFMASTWSLQRCSRS
jgi:hypothetical protein